MRKAWSLGLVFSAMALGVLVGRALGPIGLLAYPAALLLFALWVKSQS